MASQILVTVVGDILNGNRGMESLSGLDHPSRPVGPELIDAVVAVLNRPATNGLLPVRRIAIHPLNPVIPKGPADSGLDRENIDFPIRVVRISGILLEVNRKQPAVPKAAPYCPGRIASERPIKPDRNLIAGPNRIVLGEAERPDVLGDPSVSILLNPIQIKSVGNRRRSTRVLNRIRDPVDVDPGRITVGGTHRLNDLGAVLEIDFPKGLNAVVEKSSGTGEDGLMRPLGNAVLVGIVGVGRLDQARTGTRRLLDVAVQGLPDVDALI
ncbi:hypothetical protein P3T27_002107 [Kitasatospora sp. MAA19]|uniref:hypothetical protein n=1 Tax=Kitasatospora sp. MAA19 TaxID=3035090 RepID=UPI002475AD10|nr:hypothetical protein [Kitasatospora sp. MAA19]MDH6705397.1 hypothetical protein [Kitasatospora sp. MAA19]